MEVGEKLATADGRAGMAREEVVEARQALEMAAKVMCQARDLHSNTAVLFNEEAEAALNPMLVKVEDCVRDSSYQILAWSTGS